MKMGVKRRYERNPYRNSCQKTCRIRHPWRMICVVCVCTLLCAGGIVMAQGISKGQQAARSSIPAPTIQPTQTTAQPQQTPQPTQVTGAGKQAGMRDADTSQDSFTDALFVGDSRTEGLKLYGGLKAQFLTAKGIMVNTAFTKPVVTDPDGQKITIVDAISQGQYNRVYVMLGVNELGWVYSSQFIQSYTTLVRKIKQLQPSATVYVQSILPVTREKSQSSEVYTNQRIDAYNVLIREMAHSEGVQYLDVAQAVRGTDGALPGEATSDGVHLNKAYCQKWVAFLRQQTGR